MALFPALFANEKFKETVGRDFAERRQSHAYIFEGGEGSGRTTAALCCAAALACTGDSDDMPCGKCIACRKVFNGYSPDVEIISRPNDRKTIGVDAVRAIRENLWIAPNDGEYRIYVIDEADTMTSEAQNALLISLEEPPPFVIFILLVQSSEALLETVRSRATLIRMERLSAQKITEFLKTNVQSADFALKFPDRTAQIAASADGCAGKALEALIAASGDKKASKKADEFDPHDAADRLCGALISADRGAALDIMRSLPKGNETVIEVFGNCQSALRDIMAAKAGAKVDRDFYADAETPSILARKTTLKRLSELFSAFDEYIRLLDRSANASIITTLAAMA